MKWIILLMIFLVACGETQNVSVQIKDATIKITDVTEVTVRDKCSYLFTSGLTNTELDRRLDSCYMGKYLEYAIASNDVSVCDEIIDPFYYSSCYAFVAADKNNSDLCEELELIGWTAQELYENITTTDNCYYYYKRGNGKGDVCDNILNDQLKNKCKEDFQ